MAELTIFQEIICGVGIALAVCAGPTEAPQPPEDTGKVDSDFFAIPEPPTPPPTPEPGKIEAPALMRFDPMVLGQTNPVQVTVPIFNTGQSASRVRLEVAGSPAFVIARGCDVIQPGETCNVPVVFTPQTAGVYEGALMVSDGKGVQSVALNGQATNPPAPPEPKQETVTPTPTPTYTPPAPPPAPDSYELYAFMQAQSATNMALSPPRVANTEAGNEFIELPSDSSKSEPGVFLRDVAYPGQRESSAFESETATFPVERCRIIEAGSFIPLTLDHTVNTQIAGIVKAHVDRAVMSADGRLELLPWGTKFLGTMEPLTEQGQTKPEIAWIRATRPDGSAISLGAAAAHDLMGRPGLVGEVDNRLWDKYATVLGTSTIAALTAYFTTDSSSSDDSTSTGSDELSAAGQALQQSLAQVTADALRSSTNLAPRVTVDKGTVLFAVSEKDWYFPNPYQVFDINPGDVTYTFNCEEQFFRYRNATNQNTGGYDGTN